ncbi:hypothetical protein TIFTF001_012523 [Ficus carica]|uniref:UDP-N-acetylglucosamine transferase subunit ALG14 n=1 Tax=Ficus carica TaxID=3494 RepID=A0AA87ZZ71_FICCA|nr:hypothetical protein TIFTF001_012523 [Ficus carica]
MLNLLAVLQTERFATRFYIAAATDNMSLQKARSFENSIANQTGDKVAETSQFMQIYRSREVGQSYITSVWTTLVALAHGLWLMIKIRPEVILCNGPGTCVPLCIIALLFKIIGIQWSSIFYVESIARVQRLSLSGLILYKLHIADQFFVQWPQLQRKYPRAHYVGCLIDFRHCDLSHQNSADKGSWKRITARTEAKGKPRTPITLEKRVDTSKISPVMPMVKIYHAMAVPPKVMKYDNVPGSNPSISLFKSFHSSLMKSPRIAAQVATSN